MPVQREKELPLKVRIHDNLTEIRLLVKNSSRSHNFKLWVDSPSSAILLKPTRASLKDALQFVDENKDWLSKNLEQAKPNITLAEYLKAKPKLSLQDKTISVWLKPSELVETYILTDSELVVIYNQNDKESLLRVFVDFAKTEILKIAKKVSAETGMEFKNLTVRNQNTRWASRSSTGTLSFNWRMILLGSHLQDYIVRHEFAHSKFMDHSTAFWIFLNRICPSAKRLDAELTKTGSEIFKIAR